ncbi:MAG: prolipoprotein diacylglyceryl transferase family protein, partial [Patescibacteria group bacterium]
MINFFHSYLPQPIFLQLGPITIYWYGFFMALAVLAGLLISLRVAHWHGVSKDVIYDLFFYLIIFGFIGARIFYVLYNWPYFWQYP